jgi:hypothetical protein
MKIKLLVAAAATVVASSAMAQSAFEGFYGQIATGYENNSAGSVSGTTTDIPGGGNSTAWNASNQSFGGAPIVIGLGYNFSVAPKWLVGVGADYSALSQTSSTYSATNSGQSVGGQSIKVSNRFNVFIAPGYEIDKDKLAYFKAGYSSVTETSNSPNSYTNAGSTSPLTGFSNPSSTVGGYVLGLGYKQIITGGFYGFAEANYMSYSKPSLSASNSNTKYTVNPSLSTYQALIGVGYKF